jgi:hypothetical protein
LILEPPLFVPFFYSSAKNYLFFSKNPILINIISTISIALKLNKNIGIPSALFKSQLNDFLKQTGEKMPQNNPAPSLIQLRQFLYKTLFFCLTVVAFSANAASFHYQATDLTDTTAGEDLWQYSYTVSDYSFSMDSGFIIYFEPSLYSTLQNPSPTTSSNWDILVIDPNTFIPDDGTFDALSLVDNPSLTDTFSIDFIWLGVNNPGSQSFEVYDSSFSVIASGDTLNTMTTTQVPEPPAGLLLIAGLLFMFRHQKRKTISQSNNFIQMEVHA